MAAAGGVFGNELKRCSVDIFAGDEVETPAPVAGGSGHVRVIADAEVDAAFESYGEADLADAELLALAAEDAADALQRGELGCGNSTLDEVELRRAMRRAHRQAVASAQRMALGVIA